MNVDLIKRFFWIFVFAFSSSVGAENMHKDYIKNNDVEPAHYKGLEEFKTKESYRIYLQLDDDEKWVENQSDAGIETSRNNLRAVKNKAYFALADILPAGKIFRVSQAYNKGDGTFEVVIDSKEVVEIGAIKNNKAIISIEIRDNYIDTIQTVLAVDHSIKKLSIPENWSKEKGYREISSLLSAGKHVVKVSVVFNKSDNKARTYHDEPYRDVIIGLMYDLKGKGYGYGVNHQAKIAWWTQEIDLAQATKLFENSLVVNLIPHTK